MDGTTVRGSLTRFSTHALHLEYVDVEQASGLALEGDDQAAPPTPQKRPVSQIAYVAFHRNGETAPPPDLGDAVDLKIHTVGKRVFFVKTTHVALQSPSGFFAYPYERKQPYDQMFFYSHGVYLKEDLQPLGMLLVKRRRFSSTESADEPSSAGTPPPSAEPPPALVATPETADPEVVDEHRAGEAPVIGDALLQGGLITLAQLDEALERQSEHPTKRIGEILQEMGAISEEELYRALADKFHLPFIDLDEVRINEEAVAEVSPDVLHKFQVLPIDHDERTLLIAISDPLNIDLYDVLRFHVTKQVSEVLARPSQLAEYLDRNAAKNEGKVDAILEQLSEHLGDDRAAAALVEAEETPDEEDLDAHGDSDIVRLANQLIVDAYRRGASDIHIEPNGARRESLIRYRIDGECVVAHKLPPEVRRPLVARYKILARLDISECRLPQDGKIRLRFKGKRIELRIATLPTVNGNEDVILRILASSDPIPLDRMGMSERNLGAFKEIIEKPYGLVLVVGPTGSGKTTTLHSALKEINRPGTKILTAEDPVEITQVGLRQVQVQPKIGLTFARAMRSFLRSDPDVIMVGEMRDEETARTAVQASLTGHLVCSTLHTNSAPETLTRLLDMGLDPFTFSDALLGVMAQRLARRLCTKCVVAHPATQEEFHQVQTLFGAEALEERLGVTSREGLHLWKGEGCRNCDKTGYKGRVALHELLIATDRIRAAIERKAPVAELRSVAVEEGMATLVQDGLLKAVDAQTDIRQVLSVCSR
jgi:type II secretory ATPase GspE/PulE/Tfp pilus assembly ATPase PilB-like protein